MACGCNNSKTCDCQLIGVGGTTTSQKSDTERQIISDLPTVVTSDDNTVSVNETVVTTEGGAVSETIYDLSVEKCDELVRVSAGQGDPKFLNQAILTEGPITKQTDCNAGTITIGIDTDAIANDVYEDCDGNDIEDGDVLFTPENFNNILRLTDGLARYDGPNPLTANIINNPVACEERRIGPACDGAFSKEIAQIRLNNDYVQQQDYEDAKFYALINTGGTQVAPGLNVSITAVNTNRGEEIMKGQVIAGGGGIQVKRDGIYRIFYGGNLEVTWGINGIRVLLFRYEAATGNYTTVLETRYSPPSDTNVSGTTNVSGDPWPPNNYGTTAGGSSGLSMGFHDLERLPFSGSSLIELGDGDILFFGVKVSSFNSDTDYDGTRQSEFAILGQAPLAGGPGGDTGAFFGLESIDDPCSLRA